MALWLGFFGGISMADTVTRQHDELNRVRSQSTSGGAAEVITFDRATNITSVQSSGGSTAPTAPTNLAASALQPNSATYTWTDTANETSYQLERRTDPYGTWTPITLAANSTSYTDNSLSPLTTYRIRLSAVNAGGMSQPAETVFTTPSGTTLPSALAIPAAGATTTYTLPFGVTWTAASDQPWLTSTITESPSGFVLTLVAGANPSTASQTAKVTVYANSVPTEINVTQAANPSGQAVVTGVSASDGTFLHKITVTWNALAGYSGYGLWRNTVNDPTTASGVTGTNAPGTYEDTVGIQDGVIYYYWVRGINFANGVQIYSPWSVAETGFSKEPPVSIVKKDTTFGINGTIPLVAGQGSVKDLAIYPDGRILAMSESVVARYSSNGMLDTTFGSAGTVSLPFGCNGILIQPNERIVVVGNARGGLTDQLVAARLLANGSYDTSFCGTGIFAASITDRHSYADGLALQPDGKIVIVGNINVGNNADLLLVRLTVNGVLDANLNGTG